MALTACESEFDTPVQRGVVEGVIRNGEYPHVRFSTSVVPGIDGNFKNAVINWGKVTLSDGEREVILTGRAESSYLPPFIYYTQDMQGKAGRTYTLRAEYGSIHVEAKCHMPYPTPIDSITFLPTDNDTLRAATLHFTAPADTPAYYYLSMRSSSQRGELSMPCMMGTLRVDTPGTHCSLAVFRPKLKLDSLIYVAQLAIGEEWIVELNRVERAVYDFRVAYDNMIMFSTSPFMSTAENLPTNTVGGYGVWSAEGTDFIKIKVE